MSYVGLSKMYWSMWYEHLGSALNAEVLTQIARFSTYHFCRVFHWHVGYSVMEDVRLRRLSFAASELSSGRVLLDIALDHGFETHSGFTNTEFGLIKLNPDFLISFG